MSPAPSFVQRLAADRMEQALADKAPRLDAGRARAEAERCLSCADAPCTHACPTSIDVPGFIKRIATGNVRGAAKVIFDQNILGYGCARVCPVEVLCEGACVYQAWNENPIAIGRLQRFATEGAISEGAEALLVAKGSPARRRRVACVGAGPASLAFAASLVLEGHDAVVFEKRAWPGGLDTTGVAPYKLHAHDALREVEWVRSLGVEIRTGVEVGRDVLGAQLVADYDAVFLGLGLGGDGQLGIPGERGPGCVGATEWIERMKLAACAEPAARPLGRVVVVGGGNTAVDVARECAQLGAAEVTMVYRRDAKSMSGYDHEVAAARKEGVRLVPHARPTEVVRDAAGVVRALRVTRSDEDGGTASRRADDGEPAIACDLIVVAIGQSKLRDLALQLPGVALDARGCIVADPSTGATGHPKVFSGGDCVNGGKEVVHAVAAGRDAARHLHARWAHG